MKRLSADEVHARKVADLGLDPATLDLTSVEAIAASLRRAAGLLCPCAAPTLVRAVVRPLEGLVADLAAHKESIEATLEAMIAHGDLVEQRDIAGGPDQPRGALLYAAPPSFVSRCSGAALLLGITPDHRSALTDELEASIQYANHIRRLPANADDDLRAELRQLGLIELSFEVWRKAPPAETPAQHVSRLDRLLDGASPSTDIPGLTLLDPARFVRYYRGRWSEPRGHTGRFVGRRSQAYGADLWCYLELYGGHPKRFVDLPLAGSRTRGCDEAWRLQMAIDARRGEPQQFRVRSGPDSTRVVEFFSPVPMWAQRRWDAFGEPVPSVGCLFAYRFAEAEISEELRFIRETLWLAELTEDGRRQ